MISDTREATDARTRWLVAALLTLLAGTLRFWRLGDWSFWADEIATLRDAANLGAVSGYPIGYMLIGAVVRWLGTSEFTARLVPALIGTASVPILYLIGARLLGERAGRFAALFLALSSYHLFFSQFARYYTLLMLLGLLGMWAALHGLAFNNKKWLAGAVLFLALAILTHWSAALLLGALAVFVGWSSWRREVRWANVAVLFGPFLLGAILVAPRLLWFLRAWSAPEGFSLLRSALFLVKCVDRFEPGVLICAAVGAWLLIHDRRGKWLVAYGAVTVLLGAFFVGFTEGGTRFVVTALPAFLLLAGHLLDRLTTVLHGSPRRVAWVLVALVALSLTAKDVMYFTVEQGQRPRWREAAAYLMARDGTARIRTNAPGVLGWYLKPYGMEEWVLSTETDPPQEWGRLGTMVAIEEVGNVRPSAERRGEIERDFALERTLSLRVRLLDYSISLYGPREASD